MSHEKDIPAEQRLFEAADALGGSVESAQYKHLVLGLVFLKYVSDAFATQRARLDARTREPGGDWFTDDDAERAEILEDRDEYKADNVFLVPKDARWDALLALGSQPDLGIQIDRALDHVEQENPTLKGVLPKVDAGAAMSPETLGRLVSLVAKVGFGDDPEAARDVLGRVYEYSIKEFARSEGHRGGEFYTPANVFACSWRCCSPTRLAPNRTQSKRFSDELKAVLDRYNAQQITAAEVVVKLVELAKRLRDQRLRNEELGLSREETAFYDVLASRGEQWVDDPRLRDVAIELVRQVRGDLAVDWTERGNLEARIRSRIKRLLRRHKVALDAGGGGGLDAVAERVFQQARTLYERWPEIEGAVHLDT